MIRLIAVALLASALAATAARGQEHLRKIATITVRLGTIDVTASSDGYMPVQLFGSDNAGIRSSLISMTHDEAVRWVTTADSVLSIKAQPAAGEQIKYDCFESEPSFTRYVTKREDLVFLGFGDDGYVEFSTSVPRADMLHLIASVRKAIAVADSLRGGKPYPASPSSDR
jgi:hypothetical protein